MKSDEFYMKRCLQIAKNGIGTTRPNPSVGAVIVYNGKIIGEGFTSNYGENHAEVNAFKAVKNRTLLKEATLYVTLEPCSHFGKTPPCANLIAKYQIKKVIIGCLDTNPLVAGKGIEILENAKIEVIQGVLEKECRAHHKRFFMLQNHKRPYIILKWAETLDGFIAPKSKNKQVPVWISNVYARQLVHKLRAKEHAILVGANTVLEDNPKLTVRDWFGNNPTRIVLDAYGSLSEHLSVFNDEVKTIVICPKKTPQKENNHLFFEEIDFSKDIAIQIIKKLHQHSIQSLIVEGGAKTLQVFIDENLWDEALVFSGNGNLKNGIKAPLLDCKSFITQRVMGNRLKIYKND